MIIAVASGKGGTGKTTVAAALARVWEGPRIAVDMDVEAPNLHFFLQPKVREESTATIEVPVVDPEKCDGCRRCSEVCAFKAIAVFGTFPMVFPELCHGCGGCLAICPKGALTAGSRDLGSVCWGKAGPGLQYLAGRLRVGEAMSPPLMRQVRAKLRDMIKLQPDADAIVDAPPGASCPAVEAVRDADVVLLVTEPTPFGLYDLGVAHQAFLAMQKRMAVVINRSGLGDAKALDFCRDRNLPVLEMIPFERSIAEAYAWCMPLDAVAPRHHERFVRLARNLRAFASGQFAPEVADA